METTAYYFNLPRELIAQRPSQKRGDDKLMLLNRDIKTYSHHAINGLPDLLPKNSLLVFNNSRVRRARIFGTNKSNNKKQEFLLIKKNNLSRSDICEWDVIGKALFKNRGKTFMFEEGLEGELTSRISDAASENESAVLLFNKNFGDEYLNKYGHIPLPPYIKRGDDEMDSDRYQNVYADKYGSVASPTAGLHFTHELLDALKAAGHETAFITLHVGLGTFFPVKTKNIEEHKMHNEVYSISDENIAIIENAVSRNKTICAVGTTTLRCLESAYINQKLLRGEQSTNIFIYPPHNFKIVNALFTNFHTPHSTLLMLVSAFAGREFIFECYDSAINNQYKFFSYGDAMLIL